MRPQTTRLPAEPDAKLTALGASLQAIDADYEQQRAQLEAEIERAKEIQRQLVNLNNAVENCADKLQRADDQLQQCKVAATQVCEAMLSGWGTGHVDGSTYRPPDYSALIALDAAIEDFPRIRAELEQRLTQAQTNLTNFQKENL